MVKYRQEMQGHCFLIYKSGISLVTTGILIKNVVSNLTLRHKTRRQ